MRGAMASAAVLVAAPDPVRRQRPRHCPEGQYVAVVRGQDSFNRQYLNAKMRYYRDFRARWPDLEVWFTEPLVERAGRLPGESFHRPSFPTSHRARTYQTYLGLRGYATFDYRWMFAVGQLRVHDQAALLGIDPGTMALVEEAVALGYNRLSAKQAMHWSVARIALRNGLTDVADITADHVAEVLEAIRLFPEDPEFASFYPSAQQFYEGPLKSWITHLHQLEVVLFHRGQVATQPRKLMPSRKSALTLPPRMLAVAQKWLAARRLTDAPSTVDKLELAVRTFCRWLEANHPGITTFADVTRDHCLGWIGHIAEAPTEKTGKPLGVMSRIQRISGLSQFFRDTALWQYPDVPGHTLIGAGDAPKFPLKVPRYIPVDELDQLMPTIDAIACPFQRAAALVARWSGARRTEIQRLPMDCLDHYPDSTARLRLSGRKTYKERVVPLHEDAANSTAARHRPSAECPRETVYRRTHRGGDPLPVHEPRQAPVDLLPVRDADPGRLEGGRTGPPGRTCQHRTRHGLGPPVPAHRRHPAR